MPNGPFPWFNPQTLKIPNYHLPLNSHLFTLTEDYFVTFFERSLSGWRRAASNPKWFEVALGLICLNPNLVLSVNTLFISCTYSFFFLLLLLGASYSSQVTTGIMMRSGSYSYAWSTGIRSSANHSLVISFMSCSVSL
jgi:hypothetical protein